MQECLGKAQKAGHNIKIFEGFRSAKRQDILFDQGRKTPGQIITHARGGWSFHQYGVAAYIGLWKDERWSWDFNPELIAKYFEHPKITWGGTNDGPHYQLSKLPRITDVKQIVEKSTILDFWDSLKD